MEINSFLVVSLLDRKKNHHHVEIWEGVSTMNTTRYSLK